MLFEANEHEPLTTAPFDASTARAFVREVVHMTDAAFDPAEGWPLHPEDRSGDESAAYAGIYCGAAGTMWALTTLARAYDVELRHDYADEIVKCEERYRRDPAETSTVVPSYFLGTVGIMLARYAIAGDRTTLERILADMRANLGNPTREVLWGSPGTATRECSSGNATATTDLMTSCGRSRTSCGRRGNRHAVTTGFSGSKTCTVSVVAMSAPVTAPLATSRRFSVRWIC